MKRFLLSLTAAVTLFTTNAVANTTNINIKQAIIKQFKYNSELAAQCAYNTYKYVIKPYRKGQKDIHINLYDRFNNLYNFLKTYNRDYYKELNIAARMQNNTKKINLNNFDDFSKLMDVESFKKAEVIGILKARSYRGDTTDVKYQVIKRVNKTAVTIVRDLSTMLTNFQKFIIKLKQNAKNEKEFNKDLQNLSLIFYFYNVDVSSKPYFPLYNIPLDEMLSRDSLSSDFLTYFAQFLAHDRNFANFKNERLSKLAYYIALQDYDKAVQYVKNFDKSNTIKQLLLDNYAAAQELITKKQVTNHDRKKIEVLKKLIKHFVDN